MANLDWTVFCSPSTEYVDKTSWVESVCHSIGGSYSAAAEEVTWLQMMFTGLKWHFIVFFWRVGDCLNFRLTVGCDAHHPE